MSCNTFVEGLQQFVEVGRAETYPCTHMHMHCALTPRANQNQSAQDLDNDRLADRVRADRTECTSCRAVFESQKFCLMLAQIGVALQDTANAQL